jgi:hypothetical protein
VEGCPELAGDDAAERETRQQRQPHLRARG